MTIQSSVTELSGVGPALAARLAKIGIATISDLITHYPRQYEDWRIATPISQLKFGSTAVIAAQVNQVIVERTSRRRLVILRAILSDESGMIPAIWFGQPWLEQVFVPGKTYLFRGDIRPDFKTKQATLVGSVIAESAQLLAIYPETAGVTSKRLRELIKVALSTLESLEDPLPAGVIRAEKFIPYQVALREIHIPTSDQQLAKARTRLAFGELYLFMRQLYNARAKRATRRAVQLVCTEADLRAFVVKLPFKLTNDQRRVAWRIIQDVTGSGSMYRLLQGDVGSGKTVVAAFATYIAALTGTQSIWLAPTEILARQHYQTLTRLLGPFGIPVVIRTSQRKILAPLAKNAVIIGTHAIFFEKQLSGQVGLVVIDEQHRFGVAQRESLEKRPNPDGTYPHVLAMTATPIPRTYALALFADLDVSILREKPPGRRLIQTRVLAPQERAKAYQLVQQEVANCRQVYVVCPLITDSEEGSDLLGDQTKSVEAEYRQLKADLSDLRIGLLHGRLAAATKAQVMADFSAGRLDLLVTTSVIEVGVDVPNASVMLIEGADRFGLAQLHQLRGRVGRGEAKSYCLLIAGQWSSSVGQRLRSMESIDDGFALAEIDLQLRGPGELLGRAQSGLPNFRLASLFDLPLVERVQTALLRDQKSK